jgi:hypothetical protein
MNEANLGLTFASLARSRANAETANRSIGHARAAYDAVVRFKGSVALDDDEASQLDSKFEQLRSALRELGERV